MWGKGRTKNSFSVDRIKEELGYIEGNLQCLRVGKNKKKHLEYDWQTKTAKLISAVTEVEYRMLGVKDGDPIMDELAKIVEAKRNEH